METIDKINRLIELSFKYSIYEDFDDDNTNKYKFKLQECEKCYCMLMYYDDYVAGIFFISKKIVEKYGKND